MGEGRSMVMQEACEDSWAGAKSGTRLGQNHMSQVNMLEDKCWSYAENMIRHPHLRRKKNALGKWRENAGLA